MIDISFFCDCKVCTGSILTTAAAETLFKYFVTSLVEDKPVYILTSTRNKWEGLLGLSKLRSWMSTNKAYYVVCCFILQFPQGIKAIWVCSARPERVWFFPFWSEVGKGIGFSGTRVWIWVCRFIIFCWEKWFSCLKFSWGKITYFGLKYESFRMPHTASSPPQGIASGDSLISFLNSQMS